MGPIAAALSPATIAELSSYYSRQTSGGDRLDGMALQARGEPSDVARGEEIARRGIPRQDVPACRSCHGPSSTPRNPAYPVLAGQHAGYLTQQLALLQGRRRGGSAYVRLMHKFVDRLTPEQIRHVAAYYASDRPNSGPSSGAVDDP